MSKFQHTSLWLLTLSSLMTDIQAENAIRNTNSMFLYFSLPLIYATQINNVMKSIKYKTRELSQTTMTTVTLPLHGFPDSLTPLWPHDAGAVEGDWIIFSRRFIIRSCSCRHWTWSRFCWCRARRTSLHVSSMARLDLFCCCSMACITRSFFLLMDSCLLARRLLAEVGRQLESREWRSRNYAISSLRRLCLVLASRAHLWVKEVRPTMENNSG